MGDYITGSVGMSNEINDPWHWAYSLTEQDRAKVDACRAYAKHHSKSGMPGHNLFLLVAKLTDKLDFASDRGFQWKVDD